MNRMRSSFHPIYSSCIRDNGDNHRLVNANAVISAIGFVTDLRYAQIRTYFSYESDRSIDSKSGAKRFSTCGKNSVTRSSYTCTDERISIPIRGNALFFAISWKDRFTKGRSRSGNHPRPVRKQEIRETIKALVADCSLPEGFDSSCVASGEKQRDTFFTILPR